jgi:hypothetical protein
VSLMLVPAGDDGYENRLSRMALRASVLQEALGASNLARKASPADSAPTAPGYFAYNGLVASTTGGLREFDWRRVNLNGVLPLLVNDDHGLVLGFSSGDPLTGTTMAHRSPRSRYAKGELTRRLLRGNQAPGQGELFDASAAVEEPPEEFDGYSYWLFLVYYDKTLLEIRSEVSLPKSQNSKGFVSDWYDRILLPPYAVDDMGDDDPNGGFGPIDVPVDPR